MHAQVAMVEASPPGWTTSYASSEIRSHRSASRWAGLRSLSSSVIDGAASYSV